MPRSKQKTCKSASKEVVSSADMNMDISQKSQNSQASGLESVSDIGIGIGKDCESVELGKSGSASASSRASSTPAQPTRRRKFSEIASPELAESMSPEISECRIVQIIAEALKPLEEKLDQILDRQKQTEAQTEEVQNMLDEATKINKDLNKHVKSLQLENTKLRNQIVNQELHSRRNNLRFHGLNETKNEDCEGLVLEMLYHAGLPFHPRSIERAHRLGPSIKGKTRPIIVKFFHYKDRETVWRKLGHGTFPPKYNKLHVREDYPLVIENNRAQLLPIAIAASKKTAPFSNRPPKVQLVRDNLYINNERYTIETLSKLPETLKPQSIFTPTSGNTTAYFTKHSPLSNHYPSPFIVNGNSYSCMQQYCIAQQAHFFQDQETILKVMTETDPVKQQQAGNSIKGYIQKDWQNVAEEKLLPGLIEKFSQNQECKAMLLSTKNNDIIEAHPGDKFMGAGVSLFSSDLWNVDNHPGANIMGKLLKRVRGILQQR